MASAPRGRSPQIIDVRRPLNPRVVAIADTPGYSVDHYLFSSWLREGRDRFVITSGEMQECSESWRGALTTFDTSRWPNKKRLPQLDTYKYGDQGGSEGEGCSSYYFSLRPGFRNKGTVLLPSGTAGTRLLSVDRNGKMKEIDSFTPPVSDVWLTFWIDREIFYALNGTGEIYILRYRP
jgi:hypothetical protein